MRREDQSVSHVGHRSQGGKTGWQILSTMQGWSMSIRCKGGGGLGDWLSNTVEKSSRMFAELSDSAVIEGRASVTVRQQSQWSGQN